MRRHATAVYLGAMSALTAGFMLLPASYLLLEDAPVWLELLALVLRLLPASVPAHAVLHRTISLLLPPTRLPKLDFDGGIPAEYTTAIAVPSLLTSTEEVSDLLAQLDATAYPTPTRASGSCY